VIGNDNDSPSLLDDIEAAEKKFGCELERVTVASMVRTVAREYRPDIDFEHLLDCVVGSYTGLLSSEFHAYKHVLGKEFSRRRNKKRSIAKSRDT
jgi:hypothetical protein